MSWRRSTSSSKRSGTGFSRPRMNLACPARLSDVRQRAHKGAVALEPFFNHLPVKLEGYVVRQLVPPEGAHLGGVVAGNEPAGSGSGQIKEDDHVYAPAGRVGAEQTVDLDAEPGLFEDVSDCRLFRVLGMLHEAARQAPPVDQGLELPLDQDETAVQRHQGGRDRLGIVPVNKIAARARHPLPAAYLDGGQRTGAEWAAFQRGRLGSG